jgi:hypothetical protein
MWARPKSCRPKADAYRSHNILFFIWLANTLYVHFVPPGNLLGICNFIPQLKNCSEKYSSPSEHFCMTKMFKHFSEIFLLFCWVYSIPTYVRQLPPPPWQINPFLNMDPSPYSSAVSPSPVSCLPSAPTAGGWQSKPINDQSHNSGQQAMKVGGNQGAGRARNNQPSMGAAKAGGSWQQEQENDNWQLAMKEEGCHPVMTHCNDGALWRGGEGVQPLSLGAAPGWRWVGAFDGGGGA